MKLNQKNSLELRFSKDKIEAGCDEAGRGCLAGPVFAAAVILPEDFNHPLLNDSKQLSEKKRNLLRPYIEEHALEWAVGICTPEEIDSINILNASFLAMHKAVDKLGQIPELLLIDGNRFKPYKEIPFECIIKGDGKFMSIAAASVLAKTHRDEYINKLVDDNPELEKYNLKKNKGYGTKDHIEAIQKYGITKWHRKTFGICNNY